MKVKTSKGFTLAELLIVMAIIVVLAAIAIPSFGKQLETARESADAEAIRAAATDAYSIAYTKYITGKWTEAEKGASGTGHEEVITGLAMTQTIADFQYLTPTISVGGAQFTLSSCATDSVKATFKFMEDTTNGGIKIDTAAGVVMGK